LPIPRKVLAVVRNNYSFPTGNLAQYSTDTNVGTQFEISIAPYHYYLVPIAYSNV
jgi:hypothetical protein